MRREILKKRSVPIRHRLDRRICKNLDEDTKERKAKEKENTLRAANVRRSIISVIACARRRRRLIRFIIYVATREMTCDIITNLLKKLEHRSCQRVT